MHNCNSLKSLIVLHHYLWKYNNIFSKSILVYHGNRFLHHVHSFFQCCHPHMYNLLKNPELAWYCNGFFLWCTWRNWMLLLIPSSSPSSRSLIPQSEAGSDHILINVIFCGQLNFHTCVASETVAFTCPCSSLWSMLSWSSTSSMTDLMPKSPLMK